MASLARFVLSRTVSRNAWKLYTPQFSRALSDETSLEKDTTAKSLKDVAASDIVEVSAVSGMPEAQRGRTARISRPSQHLVQSGTNNTLKWQLEFSNQQRWENPLMGWASTGDPHSNVVVSFDTQEEAVAFAVKSGWSYEVIEPKQPKFRLKNYGANFSWNKKTRITSK